jgi:hypothetical protein
MGLSLETGQNGEAVSDTDAKLFGSQTSCSSEEWEAMVRQTRLEVRVGLDSWRDSVIALNRVLATTARKLR